MSTLFNYIPPLPEPVPPKLHPWDGRVKDEFRSHMKYAHNSISSNPTYPKTDAKKSNKQKDRFIIIGCRFSKKFCYCKFIVNKLYNYRSKVYAKPIVKGVTTVQWKEIWHDLKLKYGCLAYRITSPVVVILNDELLGGQEELEKLVEEKYICPFHLNYYKESVKEFANFVNTTTRPFVYMHFSINQIHLGTMIFMLYTDIVPETCANFMRLCRQTRGGYAGTPVHRVVKDSWIQCGGYSLKNTDMICENFIVDFDKRGVLGMANADRHVDCSTQFFIISQPAMWMKHNYVGFGQLVDGDSILSKIERTRTWYESPVQDIIIDSAGILNLDCHDIAINKNAKEYINGHIENLYEIRQMCVEMIIKRVFDEILLRYLKNLEERPEEDISDEKVKDVVDYDLLDLEGEENMDFGVESYVLEEETHTRYQHLSLPGTPATVPDEPFYIPLTDVPYPGEVESTFDLKRFLKGNYCSEKDLQKDLRKLRAPYKPLKASVPSFLPVIDIGSSSSSDTSLYGEFRMELDRYFRVYGESVSLAGNVIKAMSKGLDLNNIMDLKHINTVITDEELRKARYVADEIKRSRQVMMIVPDDHIDKKVRRRLTGFIRDEDLKTLLAKLHVDVESDEEEGDEGFDSDESDIWLGAKKVKIEKKPIKLKSLFRPSSIDEGRAKGSTIERLWEEVDICDENPPTLKDFRPVAEIPALRKNYLTKTRKIDDGQESVNTLRRMMSPHIPIVTDENKNRKVVTKGSLDDFLRLNRKRYFGPSIQAAMYSKNRPALTVRQYKEMNRQVSLATMAGSVASISDKKALRHVHSARISTSKII